MLRAEEAKTPKVFAQGVRVGTEIPGMRSQASSVVS